MSSLPEGCEDMFHLYTAYAIVRPEHLRAIHLAFVLFLSFLIFPVARKYRDRVMWWDWLLAGGALAVTLWLIAGGDDFFDRSILPESPVSYTHLRAHET